MRAHVVVSVTGKEARWLGSPRMRHVAVGICVIKNVWACCGFPRSPSSDGPRVRVLPGLLATVTGPIRFKRCRFDAPEFRVFVAQLADVHTLQKLTLSGCELTVDDCDVLATALRCLTSLTKLRY